MSGYKKIKPRFKKGSKEASEAAKKQKRGPSLKKAWKKLLSGPSSKFTPETLVKSIYNHVIKGSSGYANTALKLADEDEEGKKGDIIYVIANKDIIKLRKEMLKEADC